MSQITAEFAQQLRDTTETVVADINNGNISSKHLNLKGETKRLERRAIEYTRRAVVMAESNEFSDSLGEVSPKASKDICAGDLVIWRNDYGVKWASMVIGLKMPKPDEYPYWQGEDRPCIYLLNDSFWSPIAPANVLEVIKSLRI